MIARMMVRITTNNGQRRELVVVLVIMDSNYLINSTTQNQFEKPSVFLPLVRSLQNIPDNRRDQGKRFELAYILSLVLLGLVKGKTSIESCVEFGLARKKCSVISINNRL